MKHADNIITAIDIGTTKICVLIAEHRGNGILEIIGIGKTPSYGLARGVVVDIAPAVQSIKQAVQEAELMAGLTVESAYIGISGSHINALNSTGILPIKGRDIRPYDVAQVVSSAQTVALTEGQQILHVIPQYFILDGHHRVLDPIGMHATRLEAHVHIITGSVSSVQNLVRCTELAGIHVRDIILEPLASADAVLTRDERELGIGMLDIGGGTSDFAIYQQASIKHTHIFPIAGNLFTYDLAQCLQITRHEAERVKKLYGTGAPQHHIEALSLDEQTILTIVPADISFILEARAQELLYLVKQEIQKYELLPMMSAGLVLTGGGSLLHDIAHSAQSILQMPVRIGLPKVPAHFKDSLEHPMYATGYGLLVYALNQHKHKSMDAFNGPLVQRVFARMKSWVGDFF